MKTCFTLIFAVALHLYSVAQDWHKQYPISFQIKVSNGAKAARKDVFVAVSDKQLPGGFNNKAFVLLDNGKEMASQYNVGDVDHKGIVFVIPELKASETRVFEVRYAK